MKNEGISRTEILFDKEEVELEHWNTFKMKI